MIGNTDLFGADATVMLSSSLSSTCFHAGESDTSAAIAHHSTANTPSTTRGLPEVSRLGVGAVIYVSSGLRQDWKGIR